MKVFLTGATGLVGSHILKELTNIEGLEPVLYIREHSDTHLLPKNFESHYTVHQGDLLDSMHLHQILEDVDAVIHAAARVSFDPTDKDLLYDVNYLGTQNLVNAALFSQRCKKLVYISSIAALQYTINPNQEEPKQVSSLNHYAISKHWGELEVFRGREEGLTISILNPSFILGPGRWNRSSAQIFSYIAKKRPFYTNGILNYVDVRDVAHLTTLVLQRLGTPKGTPYEGHRIVINAGHIKFKNLLKRIAKKMGSTGPSLQIPRFAMEVAWREELIRSVFFGAKPLISRNLAKSAYAKKKHPQTDTFYYDFPVFHDLENTLDFTIQELKNLYPEHF